MDAQGGPIDPTQGGATPQSGASADPGPAASLSQQPIPKSARDWAMGCHLIALVGLLGNGIGFFLGPLVVWLIKREDHPFIDDQGKEAVNFQLTMMLATLASFLLIFVLIGIPLLILVAVVDVVFTVIAAIKAANGEYYRYPITIRFLK